MPDAEGAFWMLKGVVLALIFGFVAPPIWQRRAGADEPASPWIPVRERCPEGGKLVLICAEGLSLAFVAYLARDHQWRWLCCGTPVKQRVLYWMPIPQVPMEP